MAEKPESEDKEKPDGAPGFVVDRVVAFRDNFNRESDRACVILVAARLDQPLYQLLAATLLPAPTREDSLLEGDRALASFSARIDAAFRLGLIDAEFCRALHIVRRIRNEFWYEK